jgi:Zn-dependent alcohol dehydrogenase
MRAAVLFEQGKPQRVEELALDPPRAGEVLVRMAASGVCHSCLHAADGSWKGVPLPIVLGDEGARGWWRRSVPASPSSRWAIT